MIPDPVAEPASENAPMPEDVREAFAGYPGDVRAHLMELRDLIFDTAAGTEGVGPLEEALRWGQPSYLTSASGAGSTIRIAPTPEGSDHDYGIYFICRTSLVPTFRAMFGDVVAFEGDRGLLFDVDEPLPIEELRACVAMALTYHLSRTATT